MRVSLQPYETFTIYTFDETTLKDVPKGDIQGGSPMRTRWVSTLAAVAGIVVVCAVLGASVPGLTGQVALAQPAPASPGTPGGPGSGAPGYGPGRGYGPGFGPMGAPGWDHGRFGRGGVRRGAGIAAGAFALF